MKLRRFSPREFLLARSGQAGAWLSPRCACAGCRAHEQAGHSTPTPRAALGYLALGLQFAKCTFKIISRKYSLEEYIHR